MPAPASAQSPPPFDRRLFASTQVVSRIGGGALGAKAERLVDMQRLLRDGPDSPAGVELSVPRMVVLATEAFDDFLACNRLDPRGLAELPDERIGHAFQKCDLPPTVLGDLQALAEEAHAPLAVRSSSLLEDSLRLPFAGVYQTKMIPNNDPDPRARFRALVEAVKFVYASTFFAGARNYRLAAGVSGDSEKMAVIIQEIVGRRHGNRFYPTVSAVCRSYNYYPRPPATPEAGVVELALGLGKTIVDGGRCWSYSPRHPKAPPPFASATDMMRGTQNTFWAVNMGKPPAYDPTAETEYLLQATLPDAEYDGALEAIASTYDGASDRLRPGTGWSGPRVLDFAPLLQMNRYPLNGVFRSLLAACDAALGGAVEIELAATLPSLGDDRVRVGFLQVRPMVTPGEEVELTPEAYYAPDVLLRSREVMGNGALDTLRDIVYVRREAFQPGLTPLIAREVAQLNLALQQEHRPYMLIGFGRWGSSEPWLGIPVQWGDIAGAVVLVEATTPGMNVEPSQGAHFFQNVASLGVLCLTVREGVGELDWDWLAAQPPERETEHVRHVRLRSPLRIRVDGRARRGIVGVPETAAAASASVEPADVPTTSLDHPESRTGA